MYWELKGRQLYRSTNQTLEQIERNEGTEFGLRVFIGKRQAIVSGSDYQIPRLTLWLNVRLIWQKLHQLIHTVV